MGELLEQHRRNLEVLELQRAEFGLAVPSYIVIAIEDEKAEIARLEAAARPPRRRRQTRMDDNEMESAVLTRMSSQLDKLDGDMQNVRDRMTRLELQVGYMNDKLVRLDIQMSHGTPLPRAVIAAGSVALGFVLIMLSFVVWKLI